MSESMTITELFGTPGGIKNVYRGTFAIVAGKVDYNITLPVPVNLSKTTITRIDFGASDINSPYTQAQFYAVLNGETNLNVRAVSPTVGNGLGVWEIKEEY